jgi:hypothetical protein
MEALAARVNADERLVHRGRYVDARVLIDLTDECWLLVFRAGRIVAVERGPFVMPAWTFALRAPRAEWDRFWQASPPPGAHDLFAMAKRRVLRIEGDLHPFMANLFYFKDVMASLRPGADA